ncbi:unnamed protein product [Euphydryas editha]|uniref:DNA-directed RNA polymerase n=1 Tax=Euphydryas editha TaxID=104508 RepID=A0AAU9UMC7_EUPED|nr:unnamed protein product [Euphydryas editha]
MLNNYVINTFNNFSEDDVTYILSKLTDEELLRLLNVDPSKNIYDLNDIVQIALEDKTVQNEKISFPSQVKQDRENMGKLVNFGNKKLPEISNSQTAFYKLNHKEISSQNQKNNANFLALKKLHSLIHIRPRLFPEEERLSDEKKELIFDFLVTQLKALCCKGIIKKQNPKNNNLPKQKPVSTDDKNNEFIFLILNEEIKTDDKDDLVLVDPDTLEKNSSALILGPITTPLSDEQLKIVMNRISNELSKPEYASLLQQLSDGTLNDTNVMKNFIYGSQTRRYIKAHRCNHQSKLAKIYGGPKWLICTGYLNINTPSLYD